MLNCWQLGWLKLKPSLVKPRLINRRNVKLLAWVRNLVVALPLAKATDTLAATGELVISSADKAVEATAYGIGATTRAALDLGSKAGGKVGNNPISRGFRAGFYRPEVQACAALADGVMQPATQG